MKNLKNQAFGILLLVLTGGHFSCEPKEKPSDLATITVESIEIGPGTLTGARLNNSSVWQHPLPASIRLTFSNQLIGQTFPISLSTDLPSTFQLPLGSYSYRSDAETADFSEVLPIVVQGELNVNQTAIQTRLTATSDYQLISFLNQNLNSVRLIDPASRPLFSNTDFHFLYLDGRQSLKVEITPSDGKAFRLGWDGLPFNHNSFYFTRSGDSPPSSLSDPELLFNRNEIPLLSDGTPGLTPPFRRKSLPDQIAETSGLQWVGQRLFSINDGGNSPEIHEINPESGEILRIIQVSNAPNVDWEDLAASETHLFIGDFGNNSGNRQDLRILKIDLDKLLSQNTVEAEFIEFAYPEQISFTEPNHRFDCEAMVFWGGQLHIFTKPTVAGESDHYILNTFSGTQTPDFQQTFITPGWITGADVTADGKNLLLIGYENAGFNTRSFIMSYSGLTAGQFEPNAGKTRYLGSVSGLSQTEGIAILNREKIKISGERIRIGGLEVPPRLSELDYTGILD
jgi:hypothetical protein